MVGQIVKFFIVYRCVITTKLITFFNTVVPLLTYLLIKGELSPEEVVGMSVDVVSAGVDAVSSVKM